MILGFWLCIYIDGKSNISECVIAENSAEKNGGGIYCGDNSNLVNITLYKNNAYSNGGGTLLLSNTVIF